MATKMKNQHYSRMKGGNYRIMSDWVKKNESKKMSAKATTKRGKVTRIPSGTKARTAKKTMDNSVKKVWQYEQVDTDVLNLIREKEAKRIKNYELISRYKERIIEAEGKIGRYTSKYNEALKKSDNEKSKYYLKKISDTQLEKVILNERLEETIKKNQELSDYIEIYRNLRPKSIPLSEYHLLRYRKASDRNDTASHKRGRKYNISWMNDGYKYSRK